MGRDHLSELLESERSIYLDRNPTSLAQFSAAGHLFTGVPMTQTAN
jgi:hypothetical protein